MIIGATRGELTRLRRRSFVVGWWGITALLAFMITAFSFVAAADGTEIPSAAPGGSFATGAELVGRNGFVLGLGAASTILGVVTLSFWAVATASDYTTGLIRLLVQAQPRRLRLLAGKLIALLCWTAVSATIATVVVVAASPLLAGATGLSTANWESDLSAVIGLVLGAWANTFLAMLVWGSIGLAIAVVTRSSAIAIGVGLGYVLVIEGLIRLVAPDIADWLPGATLSAIAGGGSAAVEYPMALGLGLAYATIGLIIAGLTVTRRDITE